MKITSSMRPLGRLLCVALPLALCGYGCSGPSPEGSTDGGTHTDGGSSSSSGSSGGSGGGSGSSSGSSGGGSGGGSGSSSGGSSGAGSGSSSGGSSGSSSGGQTDQQCAAEGGEACNSCCAGNHNSGYATYINTAVGCLCGPSGACQTACSASLCMLMPALPEPGDVCDTCLNDAFEPDAGGTCLEPLEEACMPGSECGAYLECSDGCQ